MAESVTSIDWLLGQGQHPEGHQRTGEVDDGFNRVGKQTDRTGSSSRFGITTAGWL